MTRPLLAAPLHAAAAALGALGALLALAGCPPGLTGAPCNTSADCPAQQICVTGHCADGTGSGGTTGGATSGTSGGQTTGGSGGDLRIDGTVTLNGGFQKPTLNAAWVWAWDHLPTGALDAPQMVVPTDASGAFRISPLHAGKTYYLLAQYDLDADGSQAATLADALWLNPSAVTPVAGGGSKVTMDVPTFTCGVISLTDTTGTHISELLANVPSVHDGSPITDAAVTANDPGSNSQVFSLTFKTGTGAPLGGQYSWTPDGGGFVSNIPALSGIYHFGATVPQGDGYPQPACAVEHHPLGAMPSALTFLPPIMTLPPQPPQTVSWTSAPGTTEDDIYMQVQGMQGASGMATIDCFQQNRVKSPFAIPPSCITPDAGAFFPTNLVVEVVSLRSQFQPLPWPQAISIEGGMSTGSRPLCEACP